MDRETIESPDSQPGSVQEYQELLKQATLADNLDQVQSLIENWRSDASLADPTADDLKYILSKAAKDDHPQILKYLLNQGAEITSSFLTGILKEASPATFQVLLDHGWDINSKLSTGSPPLRHILSLPPHLTFFLTHGADPNLPDAQGLLPLEASAHHSPLLSTQLLIQHGAALHPPTRALHAAASSTQPDRPAVLSYLLDQGADIHAQAPDLPRASHARKPRAAGTPLHSAAKAGNRAAVELLLGRGADRGMVNEEGYSPARWARRFRQVEVAEFLEAGGG